MPRTLSHLTLPFILAAAAGLATIAASPRTASASSHSDAPLVKQDPLVNLTDVYAFVGTKYGDPTTRVLNVIASVRPFSEPGDGPHYERFASDARYSLHIANPNSGETIMRYDFTFSPEDSNYKNVNTILSYGLGTEVGPIIQIDDARQNFTQTYTVQQSDGTGETTVAEDALVGIPNVGGNVTPLYNDVIGRAVSGAMTEADLDDYTQQAITDGASGEVLFAGPRDDGFYADVPGVFDLLNVRILDNNGTLADGLGQDGGGVDGFKGFNVLTFGVQIPIENLPGFEYGDTFFGLQTGVGVYASVSRRANTIRNAGNDVENTGDWVQVNRLGNPLFNEVLVAFEGKDAYNAADPTGDDDFADYARSPEVAALINTVYGTDFATTGREDLVAIFIPDVLRVATTTDPVPLSGQSGFSPLGFIGGDTTNDVSSGWPNGRRFGDDVVDIALTAVASGPTYAEVTLVGDNVAGNDIAYNAVFPYAATPHSGSFNRKDPTPTDFEIADLNGDGELDIYDVLAFLQIFSDERD